MTNDETAPPQPVSAAEESPASLAEETDIGRLSQRPGDSAVTQADLQRDETVRRWGLVTPSATRIGRANSPEHDLSGRFGSDDNPYPQ